jgi:hypothetical protein
MTTLTDEQRKNLLKQIQDAQAQVNQLSQQINPLQSPTGQPLTAAQMGGASGVGFENTANQTAISSQVQTASEQGRPKSDAGSPAPQVMSRDQAEFALRGAGLSGLLDAKQFAGLNPAEAQRRIQAEKAKRTSQISTNTSFAFNPETIAGTKKIVDRVGIGLNDIANDPFSSKGTQVDKIKATLDASSRQIASLFSSQEEYNQAVAANPQLQQTLQTFTQMGGDVNSIANQIQPTVTQPANQNTGDYLLKLTNPEANKQAEQRAIDELIPERQVIQQELARQQQIPQEMMALYFGTEDQVGILEMKKNQALEEKRIIEQKEKNAQTDLKARASLAIEKNNAEMRVQTAKIEENRLAARNYMTGMLAKLGALNTTGAAPMALQTLETKYQIATQTLENQYKYAEQEIQLNLNEDLNTVSVKTDEAILKLEQDLTKDYETITKEIMKLQQAADRETYNLTIKYATQLRQRTTAYTKELQAEAEKNAKAFAKIAGGGIDIFNLANVMEGQYVPKKGVLQPSGTYAKLALTPAQEQQVQSANLSGVDTIRYFVSLPASFRNTLIQETQGQGTKYSTIDPLKKRYAEWQKEQEKDKGKTATPAGDSDEDILNELGVRFD